MRKFFFNLFAWTLGGTFILLGVLIVGFVFYAMGSGIYSGGKWVVNYAQSIPLKAEMKKKYPLTYGKYIGEIVEGVYNLQITCEDSFNKKSYSKVKPYISVIDENNNPLDKHSLFIDFEPNAKHRFEPESNPNYCGKFEIKDKIGELETNKFIKEINQCVRKESAIELLNSFFPKPESDDFLESEIFSSENKDIFVRKYPSVCELKFLEFSPCIKDDYLKPIKEDYYVSRIIANFDYFLCEHPEHKQFLFEVKKRWSENKNTN